VKKRQKPVIEINPVPSGITRVADVFWEVTAADGLPKVVDALRRDPAGA